MWDITDYIMGTIGILLGLGFFLLCAAGAYGIIKETNNPELFRKYEINGNAPTLITKGI